MPAATKNILWVDDEAELLESHRLFLGEKGFNVEMALNAADALELLRRYLAAGPVEAAPAFKVHYLQGALLEKQGDKAGAAGEYRASLSLARNFGLAQRALSRVVH